MFGIRFCLNSYIFFCIFSESPSKKEKKRGATGAKRKTSAQFPLLPCRPYTLPPADCRLLPARKDSPQRAPRRPGASAAVHPPPTRNRLPSERNPRPKLPSRPTKSPSVRPVQPRVRPAKFLEILFKNA